MKKIIYLAMAFMAVFATSCNEDSSLDPTLPLYQHYEVDFYPKYTTAMANFHKHTAEGEVVELNNGASIAVNGNQMAYYGVGEDEGYFDYSVSYIQGDQITFTFTRGKDKVYTNSVSRADVTTVVIPTSLNVIRNNEAISVDCKPTAYEKLTAVLFPLTGATASSYVAATNYASGEFTFTNVPKGSYTLRVTNRRQIPTSQNDAGASGLIDVYSVDSKNVRVE
ncbi:MAG: hypothetical protein II308_08420 [Muribaculaceae bacterium]|jgi:hypothetical protein|nr:hypothetical protein [Muribaculaceae bacterium]MBQ2400082.1 hypothetical protein [Muribaculaceae bacterium]MBQ2439904.1 hypothetical protein [Muribaculaceae bacterium]MBQ5723843.1 hypothetical protein [Muribaculaceae bacterium]MEE1366225.1 hypothetical protein [Muribaculaceae bacterium]